MENNQLKELAEFLKELTGGDMRDLKAFLNNGIKSEREARGKREQSEREENGRRDFWSRVANINGHGLFEYLKASDCEELEPIAYDACFFLKRYRVEFDVVKHLRHSDKNCPVLKEFMQAIYFIAEIEELYVPDLLTKIETFLKLKLLKDGAGLKIGDKVTILYPNPYPRRNDDELEAEFIVDSEPTPSQNIYNIPTLIGSYEFYGIAVDDCDWFNPETGWSCNAGERMLINTTQIISIEKAAAKQQNA